MKSSSHTRPLVFARVSCILLGLVVGFANPASADRAGERGKRAVEGRSSRASLESPITFTDDGWIKLPGGIRMYVQDGTVYIETSDHSAAIFQQGPDGKFLSSPVIEPSFCSLDNQTLLSAASTAIVIYPEERMQFTVDVVLALSAFPEIVEECDRIVPLYGICGVHHRYPECARCCEGDAQLDNAIANAALKACRSAFRSLPPAAVPTCGSGALARLSADPKVCIRMNCNSKPGRNCNNDPEHTCEAVSPDSPCFDDPSCGPGLRCCPLVDPNDNECETEGQQCCGDNWPPCCQLPEGCQGGPL